MHCSSCAIKIETELKSLDGVKEVSVDFSKNFAQIKFDDSKISKSSIIENIEKLDYRAQEVLIDNAKDDSSKKIKKLAWPLALIVGLFLAYLLISKLGFFELLSQLNEPRVSYWLIFVIGLLAGFHCVGMCGGLVVTYSAAMNKDGRDQKTKRLGHLSYNIGRLISYSVIGGILGGVGSFFGINPTFTGIVTIIAGLLMVVMGISLFTNFKILQKIQLRTPGFIAKYLFSQKKSEKPKGPFVIGLVNGFMPCGPLQAMQIYALASGSFWRGALSLALFAAGTIPIMFIFGNLISKIKGSQIAKLMKYSGLVVIMLGVMMFNRGLTNFGAGFGGIFQHNSSKTEYLVTGDVKEYQTVNMDLTYSGYSPNVLYIKKNIPVRWVINVKQISGCTNEILMPDYNIRKKLALGENVIEFTPQKTGEIKFSCSMQMVWGKFIITDQDSTKIDQNLYQKNVTPAGDSCSAESESCNSLIGAQ